MRKELAPLLQKAQKCVFNLKVTPSQNPPPRDSGCVQTLEKLHSAMERTGKSPKAAPTEEIHVM